jgi:hypothetical protein
MSPAAVPAGPRVGARSRRAAEVSAGAVAAGPLVPRGGHPAGPR